MIRNKEHWTLINESNNVDKIKKSNQKIIQQGKDNGIKLIKESITKSYKYTGQEYKDNINILVFNADAYKEVAQNQIAMF